MKKTIRIFHAVMQGRDKNFSFSADPIKTINYTEKKENDLKTEFKILANFWKTQYLLEIRDEKEKLVYFEKIKPNSQIR